MPRLDQQTLHVSALVASSTLTAFDNKAVLAALAALAIRHKGIKLATFVEQ